MAFYLQMLRSGSSGNCSILTVGNTRLLIDAGIGPRVLAGELAQLGLGVRDLTGAIFTHCHSDHLRSNTIALLAREGVPLYLNEGTWETARRRDQYGILDNLSGELVKIFEADRPFTVQDLQVEAFRVNHGHPGPRNPAGDPVGFTLHDGQDTFGYCTDIGHVTLDVLAHLKRADLLVFESNHDLEMERMSARPWQTKQWIMGDAGHLSNVQAAAALGEIFHNREGKGVVLAHLSEMCNTVGLARETAREAIHGRGDARIGVANRHHPSVPWQLEKGIATPFAESALHK